MDSQAAEVLTQSKAAQIADADVEQQLHSQEESRSSRTLGNGDLAIVALISLTVSMLVAVAAWFLPVHKQSFAVVDLPGIIEIEELTFTTTMMKANVNDNDRALAYETVKGFGPKLEAAIETVKRRCNCVLLTRGAYVGEAEKDLTAELKQALGMDGLDVAAMKAKIQQNVNELPGLNPLSKVQGQGTDNNRK